MVRKLICSYQLEYEKEEDEEHSENVKTRITIM
jgi:hypothetical protein